MDAVELLKRYRWDRKLSIRETLKIRDKSSRIVSFKYNKHQERFFDIIEDWKEKYPDEDTRPTLYIIILKARQVGFSTATEAYFFEELHYGRNKIAMVVSYDEPSAVNINEMADRFYEHLPQLLKPPRRSSRGKGILFENPKYQSRIGISKSNNPGQQCKFLIDTANNASAGSSYTINYLHVSELSKYKNPKDVMISLLQAVPQYNGIVVIESTANGLNYFHELWVKAERGEINYIPIFVAWFEHEEYTWPFVTETIKKTFIESLTAKEIELQQAYNLTYEQLHWRREIGIKSKCNGDEDAFCQEYPACPSEAFLSTGRPVFNNNQLQKRITELADKYDAKPYSIGYLEWEDKKDRVRFVHDINGSLKIYKHPEIGVPYVIGGDIAEGLRDGDWSVSQVLDNTNGEQVAIDRKHIEPDLFAKDQVLLATYYNQALIADETNNHGLTTIKELQKLLYYKQYKRTHVDNISNKKSQKFGFMTTVSSRPRIIDNLRKIAREQIELINDITTLSEMQTFIFNDSGKPEAEENCFDDTVMSLAIAHEARGQQSIVSHRMVQKDRENKHWSVLVDETKDPIMKDFYTNQKKKFKIW